MSSRSITVGDLAALVGGELDGAPDGVITGVQSLEQAGPQDVSWVSRPEYGRLVASSRAACVIVPREFGKAPMPVIRCDHPSRAMLKVLAYLAPPLPLPPPGVHASAVVDPEAEVGEGAAIGPGCVVQRGARIGARTVLVAAVFVGQDSTIGEDGVIWPGVVIRERCRLGRRVVVHPNAVIGADGFGYEYFDGRHHKIPQIGEVEIGDDVEIGAGACVDRAKFGATRIGEDVKIDNLVQVAHNVQIGAHSVIAALTGIAGSTTLGRNVVLAGKVGVNDHIHLGDGMMAAACTCIAKDIPPGTVVGGYPARERTRWLREQASLRRLPELLRTVERLVARVERLEAANDDRQAG